MTRTESHTLFIAFVAYTVATTMHFVHNAVFLGGYPNMPGWISRADVFAALAGVTGIGTLGYCLFRFGMPVLGLIAIAVYAALGFDGLAHYGLAPVAAHTAVMNLTICLEVGTAALLLAVTVGLLARQLVMAGKSARA